MARPGRKRKIEAPRFPNGQVKPAEQEPSPTLVKRLAAYSLVGMQDAQWGTVPGIFYLSRKIDETEYETAKRFSSLYSQYIAVINGPRKPKTSTGEQRGQSAQIDVDTFLGQQEASRHTDVMDRYNDAYTALQNLGAGVATEVINFCADSGQTPCGWEGMIKLRKGLSVLAVLWNVKSR